MENQLGKENPVGKGNLGGKENPLREESHLGRVRIENLLVHLQKINKVKQGQEVVHKNVSQCCNLIKGL